MSSIVEICNMALANVGVSQSIVSLDEKTKEARACKLFYEPSRNELLRDNMWPFATRVVTLALVEELTYREWLYSYRYPSDCEAVRRVIPSDVAVPDSYRDPFIISSDTTGKLVLSNQISARAEITARITDPSMFDSKFTTALSWLMGVKIAPQLVGNHAARVIATAKAEYLASLADAGVAAMNEGFYSTAPQSEFMRERE